RHLQPHGDVAADPADFGWHIGQPRARPADATLLDATAIIPSEPMNIAIPVTTLRCRCWLAALVVVLTLVVPGVAFAQVVVIANGLPITEYDIQQRTKLVFSSTHKQPTRQEVINELIDDRLKISRAKYYGFEIGNDEVESAFNGMATRQHITPQQFS